MQRVLMILSSHRLDCFRLCMDLLFWGNSIRRFDRVVLLLNGVDSKHRAYVDDLVDAHPEMPWDVIAGPRGRGALISGLQNECVRRYPDSLYFKIDEDTFVSSEWDVTLGRAFESFKDDPDLSLITPVIANNAVGFYHLLNRYPELAAEFRTLFPYTIDRECMGTVWKHPAVADWITRKFIRLEPATEMMRTSNPTPFEKFSFRFSINCICYDYRHWSEMGGIKEDDEAGWGEWIVANKKYVLLATNTLCHHYSFFVQNEWLDRTSLLEDLRSANVPGSLRAYDYYAPRLVRCARQVPGILKRRLGLAKT